MTKEKGVKGKVIHQYISTRDNAIVNNYQEIQANKQAIANNSRRIEEVNNRVKEIGAIATALSSIEYPKINAGEVGVGAGISSYGGKQGVAVGVQYMPVEDLLLGVKYAALMDNRFNGAVSGSVGYKFRLHN